MYIPSTITGLKNELVKKGYMKRKEVEELCRKTRCIRDFNFKYFENDFLKRRLLAIYLNYYRRKHEESQLTGKKI